MTVPIHGPERLRDGVDLHPGDCLEVLARMAPATFHAALCDPPYHFTSIIKRWSNSGSSERADRTATGAFARHARGFMGRTWDGGDVAFRPETWAAVLRVLKPGAHLVAFGAPKNVHRLTCAVEDAGFEVRDQLMWVFGTGFPKNHDQKKAMGKAADDADMFRDALAGAADKWEGWGTALKPGYEPIILARKPLAGTVQECLREHGTGALNIDACRVHSDDAPGGAYTVERRKPGAEMFRTGGNYRAGDGAVFHGELKPGRWPANLLHDGSDDVLTCFPGQAGADSAVRRRGADNSTGIYNDTFAGNEDEAGSTFHDDSGSAARFYYCAKATAAERIGHCKLCGERFALSARDLHRHGRKNFAHLESHPTVKPIALLRWLARLIVPAGGLVLDPFAGTGTTAEAVLQEGGRAVLIEREPGYLDDIRHRMAQHAAAEATT